MKEILLRFLIGGIAVSFFSVLADIFKPKSFAGLFGAAPSVALATLALAIIKDSSRGYVSTEAGSMMAGSIAFLIYSSVVSWILMHRAVSAWRVSILWLALWGAVAFGLWYVWLS